MSWDFRSPLVPRRQAWDDMFFFFYFQMYLGADPPFGPARAAVRAPLRREGRGRGREGAQRGRLRARLRPTGAWGVAGRGRASDATAAADKGRGLHSGQPGMAAGEWPAMASMGTTLLEQSSNFKEKRRTEEGQEAKFWSCSAELNYRRWLSNSHLGISQISIPVSECKFPIRLYW